MTARDVYEAVGIELNKAKAPSLMLDDFNYLFNKAILQTINKFYNQYDISQQTTDDIRVLKSSVVLTPTLIDSTNTLKLFGAAYEAYLPTDYFHLLNAVCEFIPNRNFKCWVKNVPIYVGARRLPADQWPAIITNIYNRPSIKMPYYYIHNRNSENRVSTNPYEAYNGTTNTQPLGTGTDFNGTYNVTADGVTDIRNLASSMPVNDGTTSVKLADSEKVAAYRYGNSSSVRLEVRYGKDSSLFSLNSILIDYLKTPQFIVLTEEQIDRTIDTSQVMEFPDYVIFEIINNLVMLILENTSNPRLQTNMPIQQSIAPAQNQIQMQQAKEQIRNM